MEKEKLKKQVKKLCKGYSKDKIGSFILKAMKSGVYCKQNILSSPTKCEFLVWGDDKQIIIGKEGTDNYYFIGVQVVRYYLKDEGITWALTKEELESK